jgi:hypothetical protein
VSPRRAVAVALAFAAVVVAASQVPAHVGGSTGYAVVAIDRATIRYTLTLWPATLPPAIGDELQRARAGEAPSADRWLAILRDKIVLRADGERCATRAGSIVPPTVESVTFVIDFSCAGSVRALLVRDDLFDVIGADHHTVARVDGEGRTWQFALAPDTREARVNLDHAGRGGGLATFVLLGIEHILTGWDHLLFLLGLLLPGGGVLALAKIITAFTVAHSVTLSLAVLELVALPDRLIEAVIALSIAAVAAENIFLQTTVRRRWIVSLCFGLVHGFGFSSVLREIGLPAHGLLLALGGFNAGVELGQALVVAVALPVLAALRRAGYERRLIKGSSIAILLVGLVLFLERAFL